MEKIEIPFNSGRMRIAIVTLLLIALLGVWLFIDAEEIARNSVFFLFQSAIVIRIISIIVIFGMVTFAVQGFKKQQGNKPGLVIDDEGITDYTANLNIGKIKWSDITEIKTASYSGSKFLLIRIQHPDTILEKLSGMKRKAAEANINTYGTPITVSPNVLKTDFKTVEKLLQDGLSEFKSK